MSTRKSHRRRRKLSGEHKYAVKIVYRRQSEFDRGALALHVTHASKRLRVSLGYDRIAPNEWDERRQRMAGRSLRATTINGEIDQLLEEVGAYFERERIASEAPTLEGLRAELFPELDATVPDANAGSLVWYFKRFIDAHTVGGRPVAVNTRKSYGVVLRAWLAFEAHTRVQYRLQAFRSINVQGSRDAKALVTAFDRFLVEHGPNGTPVVDNTRRKYLKILSTFLRWAEQETGFLLLRGINAGGEIIARSSIALTESERSAIENLELPENSRLHHIRNAMVMAMYTGLRFSEWRRVNPALWREPSQPVTTPKTGRTALVIHREPVRRVLKEYATPGWPGVLRHNSKVNDVMKDIAAKAGLNRLVAVTYAVDGQDRSELQPLHSVVSTHTLCRTKATLDLDAGATLRDVSIETGKDEETIRKHYDRPNSATHVQKLGVDRVEDEVGG